MRRRKEGQRDTYCRPCRSEYGKEHYARNKQRYVDQAGARKRALAHERMTYLLAYFAANPCADCGETDPVVLEFDHLRDKKFTIGVHLIRRPWQEILDEIAKCDVVCANCHRRRTAQRRGHVRYLLSKAGDEDRTRA